MSHAFSPFRRHLLRAGMAGSGLALLRGLSACGQVPGSIDRARATGGPLPRGLHVSFTGDPHSTRTVTWFTDGTEDPGTVVEYGPVEAGQALDAPFAARATGTSEKTYGVDAVTHRAHMEGLDPSTPIRYRVGDGARWSQAQVLSPAAPGAFRFAHFGDHGMSDYSRLTVHHVLARNPSFAMIAGDLSYANGNQPLWDDYFNLLEPLAAAVPLMCAPGNHEDEDNGALGYKSRTSHPGKGTFYSFDYNNVHFLVSSGGALVSDGTLPEELATIEADLARAAVRRAAGEIDFIVVVQHFTIWTDEDGRNPANPTLVALEENILLRYGVDLLLDGHDHGYQRSHPMAFGQPLPLGYVQVCTGVGGVGVRTFVEQAPWSAARGLRYGFTEYEVDGPVMRVTTWATADKEGPALPQLEVMDQFELRARGAVARFDAVKPLRAPDRLLTNIDGIARHTRDRNRRHLAAAHLHV